MLTDAPAPIRNMDAQEERARDLFGAGLNGLAAALMTVGPPAPAGAAQMELHFINDLHVAVLLAAVVAAPATLADVFAISGGHRIRAGIGAGEVRCTAIAAGPVANALRLTIAPVGDYSTYRLEVMDAPNRIDPFFAGIDFKFRPGCFTNDCTPPITRLRPPEAAPAIDYLAKDYDSFRYLLITAMAARVPGWQVTSEADFDQVLIDTFAAAADELSDYQDRVMNEAYLGTARRRVSLARHARLMDYHIHQGHQSSTWGRLTLRAGQAEFTLSSDLTAWAGGEVPAAGAQIFSTLQADLPMADRVRLHPGFNRLDLHDWSGARPALAAGTTTADVVPGPDITAAALRDAINSGRLARLVLAEELNPLTGQPPGRDMRKRQILRLRPNARLIRDPLAGVDVVRLSWAAEDNLRHDYAFTTQCPGGPVSGISAFFGNLVPLHHGLQVTTQFHEPGSPLPVDQIVPGQPVVMHRRFQRRMIYGELRDVLCPLPHEFLPLAFLPTPRGGLVAPRSTLRVSVQEPGGAADRWDEVISLIPSDDSAENGDHFMVEVDEGGGATLRFGNGVNGRVAPVGARIIARYQVGGGTVGNVGAEAVNRFLPLPGALSNALTGISNPFDVTDGTDPEPVAEILRNVPEAFRARQLRAITLADYIARAEAVPGVARAVASYAWTGSWRTVRLVIDPEGRMDLPTDLITRLGAEMEALRLIGEDVEIRPPRFVPAKVEVRLCLRPGVWPEDVRAELEAVFSTGWLADGRRGFFHPDAWTFGQDLHRSQIAAAVMAISGVDHITRLTMKRLDAATPGNPLREVLEMGFDEIVMVQNDPDHMERGTIRFEIAGGAQ